ncbi:hypothetical protein Scep_024284 [Stephania cephalantha]|uniref:Uncharacterized protein n=1 Tax=Stephania cephalantha TaxID=152367 RepID=A0AAP0F567_9MAGN
MRHPLKGCNWNHFQGDSTLQEPQKLSSKLIGSKDGRQLGSTWTPRLGVGELTSRIREFEEVKERFEKRMFTQENDNFLYSDEYYDMMPCGYPNLSSGLLSRSTLLTLGVPLPASLSRPREFGHAESGTIVRSTFGQGIDVIRVSD